MRCQKCNAELPEEARFCMLCGTEVIRERLCRKCGRKLMQEARFCMYCGTAAEAEEPVIESKLNVDDEEYDEDIDEEDSAEMEPIDWDAVMDEFEAYEADMTDIYTFEPKTVEERRTYVRAIVRRVDGLEILEERPDMMILKDFRTTKLPISFSSNSADRALYFINLLSEAYWESTISKRNRILAEEKVVLDSNAAYILLDIFLKLYYTRAPFVYWAGITGDGGVYCIEAYQKNGEIHLNRFGTPDDSQAELFHALLDNQTERILVTERQEGQARTFVWDRQSTLIATLPGSVVLYSPYVGTKYAFVSIRPEIGLSYFEVYNLITGKPIPSYSKVWGGQFLFTKKEPFDELLLACEYLLNERGGVNSTHYFAVRPDTGEILRESRGAESAFSVLFEELEKKKYSKDTYKTLVSPFLLRKIPFQGKPID